MSFKFSNIGNIACISAFLGLTGWIFLRVSQVQTEPYMDEIFHVPQAQSYCSGNYTHWDPMITTLPGLYLISTGLLRPIGTALGLSNSSDFCSTFNLRSVNLLFISGILLLTQCILKKLHSDISTSSQRVLTSITLTTLPVLYFFSFLYYTDAGSTFFVLFSYLLTLHHAHWGSAASGSAAIMFRQTNVVWVAFFAAITAIDTLKREFSTKKHDDLPNVSANGDEGLVALNSAVDRFIRNPSACISFIKSLFSSILPYALTVLGFLLFVYFNNGIVVGAKTDHQAALHIPQLFYFLVFVGTFSFAHLIDGRIVPDTLLFIRSRPTIVVVITLFAFLSVWKLTFVHRYLLADNRHYTFYIWARLFRPYPIVRYVLIFAYMFIAYAMCRSQSRLRSDALWTMTYFLCASANLIPSTLLELRYFIVPYLLFRLNVPVVSATYRRLAVELGVHVIVNVLTLYMFMYRPFRWNDSDDVQRFMW